MELMRDTLIDRPGRASTLTHTPAFACRGSTDVRRLKGIVRGGSILAKWCLAHHKENPHFDEIAKSRRPTTCHSALAWIARLNLRQ